MESKILALKPEKLKLPLFLLYRDLRSDLVKVKIILRLNIRS